MTQLLADEGEYNQTVMRHADHFLDWASAADSLYQKGNKNILLGLSQFRFIYPHLQSAYERLSQAGKTFPKPAEADRWLSNFPLRCAYLLDLHLPPRQRIPILDAALTAARRLGDKQSEGADLGSLGIAYAALGDARKAIELYEQRMEIAREIGDRRGEGNALGNLGLAYADLGEKEKAREHWQQALGIFRVIESPHVKTVEGWLAGLDGDEPEKQQVNIQDFVRAVIQAHRAKSPQAAQYFDMLGKLTRDENSPPEIQQLGRVLQKY